MTQNQSHSQKRTIFRVTFGLFTAALLTATHWPGLAIHGPIDRTDLIIHATVFGIWAALLGKSTRLKYRHLLILGMGFAIFDESTQPIFSRTFDLWDMAADTVGVMIGGFFTRSYRTQPE